MSLFDKPLSRKGQKTSSSAHQMRIRPVTTADIPALQELERQCYRPLKKGVDGKFLSDIETEVVVDEDFGVETLPVFAIDNRWKKMLDMVGKECRMNILGRGSEVLGACAYIPHSSEGSVDILLLLVHPKAPLDGLKKLVAWFEDMATSSLRELRLVYDLPDLLDTPMQRIFTYLSKNGWSYELKRNIYGASVKTTDAWQFSKTVGENKRPQKDEPTLQT